MAISYIRLISGDEIVGDVEIKQNGKTLRITEPLAMESMISSDNINKRYIIMTRYAPFIEQPFVDINLDLVLMHAPVSQVVADYYSASLDYCVKMTDSNFNSGIAETTATIRKILEVERSEEQQKEYRDTMSFIGSILGSNTTIN